MHTAGVAHGIDLKRRLLKLVERPQPYRRMPVAAAEAGLYRAHLGLFADPARMVPFLSSQHSKCEIVDRLSELTTPAVRPCGPDLMNPGS